MRVTTRITYDMATWEVLEHEFFDYHGEVAECKGDQYAKQQSQEQFDLEKSQIALQNQRFDELHQNLSKYLSGDIGYSDSAVSAMKSNFLNNNARDYSNAGTSIRDMLIARGGGGDLPTGGGFVRGISGLMGAQADSRSSGLLNLTLQNEQQKLANQFNASSVLSGNAAALSPSIGTTGEAGSSALASYIKSKTDGAWAKFAGGLGQGIGQGAAAFMTGGASKLYGGSKPAGSNG